MNFKINDEERNIFFRCVEDSNEAIMITNLEGLLIYVNPAWCRIYGYSKEEALRSTPKILHSGVTSPELYDQMWKDILDPQKGFWKGEIINRAKNGVLIPVLLSITSYKSGLKVLGYLGIALDVSHRKELEGKVAHQDRLASVGLLASGLAHEVGTPLGVIRGRAEFLTMQLENPSQRKSLEVIVTQIDRISKLIRSLLRISRATHDVQVESVVFEQVVEEVMSLVGQNFTKDSVQLIIEIPSGLKVMGDFNRLEQVILNLAMNSIHAIRKSIELGRTGPHFFKISAEEKDQRALVHVEDSGCGISRENQKKLFKPFFTTKEVGQGTGLGLAITSQLITEMKGSIIVKSQLGEGTTFTMDFALA